MKYCQGKIKKRTVVHLRQAKVRHRKLNQPENVWNTPPTRFNVRHTSSSRDALAAFFPGFLTYLSFYPALPVMAAVASPTRERKDRRPSNNIRHPTAPSVMSVNGHFANMGENPTKEQYEHGIQVINENQEFKYATTSSRL